MKLFFLIAAGGPRHPVSRLTIGVVKAQSDRLPFFRQDEHVLKVIRCFHQGPNNLMQRRFTSLPELTGRRTLLGDPRQDQGNRLSVLFDGMIAGQLQERPAGHDSVTKQR